MANLNRHQQEDSTDMLNVNYKLKDKNLNKVD